MSLSDGIWIELQTSTSRRHKSLLSALTQGLGVLPTMMNQHKEQFPPPRGLRCAHTAKFSFPTPRWAHLLHSWGWHFPACSFSPLSCFPSKFSSNWKVPFWRYFSVPEVIFFFLPFYFLSLFFSWCSACFIHPAPCAELFPFPITPSSDAPAPTLLTQPVPGCRKLNFLSTLSALAAYPALHCSVAGNIVDLLGLPEHFSWRKYPKLWNASLGML